MSHVTDGELHAYLDGALDRKGGEIADRVRSHLEACAECAERLRAEQELRDRTTALLDAAGPRDTAVPPFEEIRRRAAGAAGGERGHERRSSGPPRGWGLAWAASVILALGLGWAGRGLGWRGADLRAPETVLFEAEPSFDERSADPEARDGVDRGVPRNDVDTRSEAQEAEVSSRPDPAGAGARSGERGAELGVRNRSVAAPADEPDVVLNQPMAQAAGELRRKAAEDELGKEVQERDDRMVQRDLAGREEVARAREPTAAVEEEVSAPVADSVQPAEERARLEAQLADSSTEAQRRAVEAAESELELDALRVTDAAFATDGKTQHVVGLEVISVEQVEDGLLIRQRLPDGGVLELRYVSQLDGTEFDEAATPSADQYANRANEGGTTVVRTTTNGWLIATAPTTREELERILSGVR